MAHAKKDTFLYFGMSTMFGVGPLYAIDKLVPTRGEAHWYAESVAA